MKNGQAIAWLAWPAPTPLGCEPFCKMVVGENVGEFGELKALYKSLTHWSLHFYKFAQIRLQHWLLCTSSPHTWLEQMVVAY